MKTIKTTIVAALCLLPLVTLRGQVSFGQAEKLTDDWRFLKVDSAWNAFEHPDMKDADYDDSRWRRVTLPHDWGVEQPMSPDKGSCQGYLAGGVGWYRKAIGRPVAGSRTWIYFEGVYNYSEVYINGHLLGIRPSGFASFLYDLTPYLTADGRNVLAVRVSHAQEFDSRWYTGSGIYRNVWLVTAPDVHLAPWGTAYRLKSIDAKKAVVDVDVEVADERECWRVNRQPRTERRGRWRVNRQPRTEWKGRRLQAVVELHDASGRTVATARTAIGSREKKTVRLSVSRPQRWTLQRPYLYTLVTTLSNGDRSEVKAGLRTLDFSPERGFALNGQWMKVKGVCLHDDAGALGTAVPKAVWKRRLQELKAIGVNAIRMSHNPHTPELYDLCDELGLLVMDEASDEWEFPKRKWMKGWNQGRPELQGTYSYFEEWIERDVADMVRRDRCHPSIFLWSIGNEVDYPNDPYTHPVLSGGVNADFTQPVFGGYKPGQPHAERIGRIALRLASIVKGIDPSRPTTGALAGVVMSNETEYPTAIDVVGYNYTESRYHTDHEQYPQRIIYGSENRHDLAAWKAVTDNDHIFGQFLWTGIDYLGESGAWPARGSWAGLLDVAGHRKPIGWYRAALWCTDPVCYVGTSSIGTQRHGSRQNNRRSFGVSPYANDTWNYEPGRQVRVVCYTNAASARLLLNGQSVGGSPKRDDATGILYWDIDYAPGTLRCEADNGASYEIRTAGAPAALRVTTDSVAHVFIEVTDSDGNRVTQADNEVTIELEGAELLGMENANMMDTSVTGRQRKNTLRAFQGRLVAYIRPTTGKGLRITATAPFLKSAECRHE